MFAAHANKKAGRDRSQPAFYYHGETFRLSSLLRLSWFVLAQKLEGLFELSVFDRLDLGYHISLLRRLRRLYGVVVIAGKIVRRNCIGNLWALHFQGRSNS